MKLFIRADADSKIGTGHVMRCIALAQAWQDQGGVVTFISHCESSALHQRIMSEGFSFIPIKYLHPHPDDLLETLEYLKHHSPLTTHHSPNWLVLDGYHFTPDYQKTVREAGIKLLVIDDIGHLQYYHTDVLLNQNIYAPDLKYNCDEDTILLLGTRYALLRREFLKYKGFKRNIPERAKNILITLGGGDPDNVTLKVMRALNMIRDHDIEIKVVFGPANPNIESVRKELALSSVAFHLLESVDNMTELMVWADVAVSAGGSTCWELGFIGVPNIIIVIAENQKLVAEGLAKADMSVNLGWHNNVDPTKIAQEIIALLFSAEKRRAMIQKVATNIDGVGARRVIRKINCVPISIRKATETDCELIWNWANDPVVRLSAFCSGFIKYEEHIKWFYDKLYNSESVIFIGYNNKNQPVGQIRFDKIKTNEYEIDVSIDKDSRGKGYGVQLIKLGIIELLKLNSASIINAFVKSNNYSSKSIFIKAGFFIKGIENIKNTEAYHLIWKKN
jgi:UDP-2,4-diacetamido-2,4,6-trideoxy-beta-L-altropyranose hydrolase